MSYIKLADVVSSYPQIDPQKIQAAYAQAIGNQKKKIIVIDDDPTGIQTVHGISVYTAWDEKSILQGFADEGLFFILTNSRGMPAALAERTNRQIALNIIKCSQITNRDFIVISRSDSTLRGHYPLETMVLKETFENNSDIRFDGEIICPFFVEGGRYTAGNTHYVKSGDDLIPAGETEFSKDKTFGYKNSDLKLWIEEKTDGRYPADRVIDITLDMLRRKGPAAVRDALMEGKDFCKVIVNALSYDDIKIFCIGYIDAANRGKRYMFRSSAAIPKILGGILDQPLLQRKQLVARNNNGGLIVVGSHVKKTTEQLEHLFELDGLERIAFNSHLVVDTTKFNEEIQRVKTLCNCSIAQGLDTVVYTRRDLLHTDDAEKSLEISKKISEAIAGIVADISVQPAYIIAKGGITSSDIGVKGLGVWRAYVLGQVLPGIPVWKTGTESKFPGMSYIIFPGNVGGPDALKTIVDNLRK